MKRALLLIDVQIGAFDGVRMPPIARPGPLSRPWSLPDKPRPPRAVRS